MKFHSYLLATYIVCSVICVPGTARAEYDISLITPVLNNAEKFFVSLNRHDYSTAWELLSKKTHNVIINDVYKSYKKMGGSINKEEVQNDFHNRNSMFRNYWDSFVRNFDSDMILNNSRWEIGYINKQKAEIHITHKKSRNPAKLLLFKEQGDWKVGLTETFWSRKSLY